MKRLGYGSAEDKLDFQALKDHKFFEGIDFEKIKSGELDPPISQELRDLLEDEKVESDEADGDEKEAPFSLENSEMMDKQIETEFLRKQST